MEFCWKSWTPNIIPVGLLGMNQKKKPTRRFKRLLSSRRPDLRIATYLRTSRSPRRTGYCECEAIARQADPTDNAKWRQCPLQPAKLVGESGSPRRGERRHSHVCRRRNRTKRNQRGGEPIGKGGYGCVYRPSIPCGNSTNDRANAFRGLSSPNHVTKLTDTFTATEEKDKGNQLRIALETTHLAPNNVLLAPSAICGLPAALTEEQKSNLGKCSIGIADPYLVQLKYGGTSLDKFKCPERDRGVFLYSLYELFNKLNILHDQNIAHLDIKPANIVTMRQDDGTYLTRFVDIGFMLDINRFDEADEGLFIFKSDYSVWPFEARYLAEPIIDPFPSEINNFYSNCVENLPLIGIPNRLYYNDAGAVVMKERIFDDPAFMKNYKQFFRDAAYERKIDVIAKAVDTYSLGYTLALVYRKLFGHTFLNMGILMPVLDEWNKKLYEKVSIPMYNLVLQMMHPYPNQRYTVEEAANELNAIVKKLNAIMA